jgi:hypothetical protein
MAAHPATPIQLARACLRAGFDFVAPISWGEELLATNVLNAVRDARPSAAIVVHCPFVAEALRAEATPVPLCYFGVAPPVATARYLREAFKPRSVSITYAGRCPGATAADIDAAVLPEILLGQLVEAGVVPVEQPRYFDELLPPDRSRYASIPGGVPDAALLMAATGASLREAAPTTLATVAAGLEGSEEADSIIIDLESSCGCVCGRDRFAVSLLEPPRSTEPVVSPSIMVSLTDDRVTRLAQELGSSRLLHRLASPTQEKDPIEVQSVSESGPEADWFTDLESDAAAFPEPERNDTSLSSEANPEAGKFALLLEESLFVGRGFEPRTAPSASRARVESRSSHSDSEFDRAVRAPPDEMAVQRAVFTDGPEAANEPGVAGRQLTVTLEPWVRPSAIATPSQAVRVDPSHGGRADAAIPTAIPDDALNESGPPSDR